MKHYKILQNTPRHIMLKCKGFLIDYITKSSGFYGLPKTHKPE